jgi:predicted acylesterase/phospholipase RssA
MSVNPVSMRALIRGVAGRLGRTRRPRTAFVLSGGASLGALQVGMLRALYERGIAPDLLVAASAGAFNAAFVASRPQTVETADVLARPSTRGRIPRRIASACRRTDEAR